MRRRPAAPAAAPRPRTHEDERQEAAQEGSPPPEAGSVEWLARLHADLAQTVGGVLLRGCRAVPVGAAEGSTVRPTTAAGRLVGWSVRESSGGAYAYMRLLDGANGDGEVLAVVSVAAEESQTVTLPGGGVSVTRGLFVELSGGGTIDGAVYLGAAD